MSVPLAPYIPGSDPPIRRHKTEYMPVPLGLVGGWGFAPISDWAEGLAPGKASFETPKWIPSSSTGRVNPFSSPVTSDGVDDGSAG